jgi:hypothetical protein
MIEQPAVARAVVPLRKRRTKPIDIEPSQADLALVDPTEEPDLAIIRKQVDAFIILRFVDEIAVGILNAADLVDILLDSQIMFKPVNPRRQGSQISHRISPSVISLLLLLG